MQAAYRKSWNMLSKSIADANPAKVGDFLAKTDCCVIAHALSKGDTVVTWESKVDKTSQTRKVPYVSGSAPSWIDFTFPSKTRSINTDAIRFATIQVSSLGTNAASSIRDGLRDELSLSRRFVPPSSSLLSIRPDSWQHSPPGRRCSYIRPELAHLTGKA